MARQLWSDYRPLFCIFPFGLVGLSRLPGNNLSCLSTGNLDLSSPLKPTAPRHSSIGSRINPSPKWRTTLRKLIRPTSPGACVRRISRSKSLHCKPTRLQQLHLLLSLCTTRILANRRVCDHHNRLRDKHQSGEDKLIPIWQKAGLKQPLTPFVDAFSRTALATFSPIWKKKLDANPEFLVLDGPYLGTYKLILDWIKLCIDEGNDVKFPDVSSPTHESALLHRWVHSSDIVAQER